MLGHAVKMIGCRRESELMMYFMEGGTMNRFDQKVLNLSIDVLQEGRIQYVPPPPPGASGIMPHRVPVTLPGHATMQIRILYCFIQYIKYLYDLSDRDLDIRMFRKVQYDDFRTNLYVPDQPIYEEIGWVANRNDMVDEYLAKKEEESRRRTPAADFQRQIKYDISAYPKLVHEKHYATWRRQFKAIAIAQGLSEVLDISIDTSIMDFRQRELDKTKNQAMYPVFQQTLLTNATKAIVLKQETTGDELNSLHAFRSIGRKTPTPRGYLKIPVFFVYAVKETGRYKMHSQIQAHEP